MLHRITTDRLLIENVVKLAPFLFGTFNRSMTFGVFPTLFKSTYITPLLKKPDLDASDAKS